MQDKGQPFTLLIVKAILKHKLIGYWQYNVNIILIKKIVAVKEIENKI